MQAEDTNAAKMKSSGHKRLTLFLLLFHGDETFHLIDLAYQQKFLDDRVELRLGRIAAGDDFLVSPHGYLRYP